VRITEPYWLGVTEVTQGEYQRVMGVNPSRFQGDPKRPVEQVSWNDAVEFCRRLSELPGEKAARRRYSLPTEAQWERACRAGGDGRRYFSAHPGPSSAAEEERLLGGYAWFEANSGGKTHPVAQKRPNAWGLYDMYGSVWEWCQDWYDKEYYAKSPTENPAGPATGSDRVYRGGTWSGVAGLCRSAVRGCDAPGCVANDVGLRVAFAVGDKLLPLAQDDARRSERPAPPEKGDESPAESPPRTQQGDGGLAGRPVPAAEKPPGTAEEGNVGPQAAESSKPVKRAAAPDEAAQAKISAAVQKIYASEYAEKQEFKQLALAARLISEGRKAGDGTADQFVMFSEGADVAARQGDCLLGLLALDDQGKRFEFPADETKIDPVEKRKMALVAAASAASAVTVPGGRHAQTLRHSPLAFEMIAESALGEAERALRAGQYDAYDAWCETISSAKKPSGKAGSPLARAIQERLSQLDEWQPIYRAADGAKKKLQTDPGDPSASKVLGMFYCLVEQKWDRGLPLLAKGSGPLSEAAARLAAQRGDGDAQRGLADALWNLASSKGTKKFVAALMRKAACYWYEELSSRLAGAELREVQRKLTAASEAAVPRAASYPPFSVPLHGLAGLAVVSPKKISGKGQLAVANGATMIQGEKTIEYDQVPASAYVLDLEVTMLQPGGSLYIKPADAPEGISLELGWDAPTSKVLCRLVHYLPRGWFYGDGSPRTYDLRERLAFTVYGNDGQQRLFENDRQTRDCGLPSFDARLRISTNDKTLLAIHRCEFRPWRRDDTLRTGLPMPPGRAALNAAETALRLHLRNWGLSDRPTVKNGYVVAASGTAMQWIEPGDFDRRAGKNGLQTTKVTLSRGFWIGRYEMTQAEWLKVMPLNPSRVAGSPFLPVDSVGLADVSTFCTLLNKQESAAKRLPPKCVYRLPTEAEWEYASLAGAPGSDFGAANAGCWSRQNSGQRPHEVGELTCNAWGLYDMQGNAPEWCLDAWRDEPEIALLRVTDPFAPAKSLEEDFVARGGGWMDDTRGCSSGSRRRTPAVAGGYRGFRLVLGPPMP
jgi:formylglycine-generating enzyme required for sulfatase activity